ncbi:Crp/Fnr family transcriptional regulator [Anaerobacillus sp. CMMVII]|uniref:Crp/Fnr family transcriptional regulator n=1 Tax=Anaerobacillus sp. CMMVII TaxID=2755588 RepID=UPI0021B757FF|nr:Crp/Fnr family transcriptional regulator [Anaerobacillus sp. CMMVII]MCT8137074.1 Crp/Fnr family transcriptional regulator [Anaerobacillus sp. CMMVII]
MKCDCILSCVGKVPIFKSLSDEETQKVSSLVTRKSYKKGEMLFLEEQKLDCLFIVHVGKVKISRVTSSGQEHLIRILATGDFIGEDTLFEEKLTDTFAEAIEPAEACIIRLKDMQKIINETPAIGLKLLTEVSRRLKKTEQLLNILQMQSIDQRVATILMDLMKEHRDKQNKQTPDIKLDVKKGDLAKFIGITPESLSRKLSLFQEKGWIELIGQRQINIKDEGALLKIVLNEV